MLSLWHRWINEIKKNPLSGENTQINILERMLVLLYYELPWLQTYCQLVFLTQENVIVFSGRTVAPTHVVRNVHCEEAKFGESCPEFIIKTSNSVTQRFWGQLSLFHPLTVHITHTHIHPSSPLGQNHVFPVEKNLCRYLYYHNLELNHYF